MPNKEKNWPLFVDEYGTEKSNRTARIDPLILRQLALTGEKRGYGREFPVALAGAETTFGRVGHGSVNPLSYKWSSRKEFNKATKWKAGDKVIKGLIESGMPLEDAYAFREKAERYLRIKTNIDKAFDVLDEKRKILQRTKRGVTPERLAWLYQGTGVPNKWEVPSRIAYGKPVAKNTPESSQPVMVRRFLDSLTKPGSINEELGRYIRELR